MCWAYDLKKHGSILMAGDDGGRGQSLDVAGCMSMVLQSIERCAFMCLAYDLKKPASIPMAGDDAGRGEA